MSRGEHTSPITVVGGCIGSGACTCVARGLWLCWSRRLGNSDDAGARELHANLDPLALDILQSRAAIDGFALRPTPIDRLITFDYYHALETPRIYGRGPLYAPLEITAARLLRFGLIEGDAVVKGDSVVYDPQDAVAPKQFAANGSTARRLALVLNRQEARLMTGLVDASADDLALALIKQGGLQVVVIKQGVFGAVVHDGTRVQSVPAYLSHRVWKLGSGDTFAAHFAFRWLHEERSPADSADLASRATAYYCETRGFATPETLDGYHPQPIVPSAAYRGGRRPKVYLAGPFFTLARLWLVEQARHDLRSMDLSVFSPYHDVGHGSAEDVVALDLKAIDEADLLFAIGDGLDSGTMYEIGYARAKGKPVVMYCEDETNERKKMMQGSGCILCDDYVSAIYHALWTACAL